MTTTGILVSGKRKLLLVGLAVFAVQAGEALAQFNYAINDSTVTITWGHCPIGAVTIPDTIYGLPVTSIGDGAFAGCTGLTSVTIPNSVTTIGDRAFAGCTGLTSVTIGNSVTSIREGAFLDCTSLTSVTIPNSVTRIGNVAFWGCTGLTNITIPNSVTSIGGEAFSGCTRLTAITVDPQNSVYSSADGVLFDKNQTTLIQFLQGKAGSYTIPNGVASIGGYAFSGCTGLTSIAIPNSVTSIGGDAFAYCTSLTSVAIPDSVTSIGPNAFRNCTRLTSVTIPNSVTNIEYMAFFQCSSLTSVTIPNSVTSIGWYAFTGCTSLVAITVDPLNKAYSTLDGVLFDKEQTRLIRCPERKAGAFTIPDSVTSIGDYAFYLCTGLPSITIPNSVTSIGDSAFSGCSSLTSVTIGNGITSMDGYALVYGGARGTFAGCTNLTNVTMGNNVARIGHFVFAYCTSLTSVTIPHSVTSMSPRAFSGCSSLMAIYFEGNAPDIGEQERFDADNSTFYHLPGTTGWKATVAGRPTAIWVRPAPVILSSGPGFGVQTNVFGFTASWATNNSVIVEASTSLTTSTWSPVSTNTLIGGTSYFSDPQWAHHPRRFYRVRAK